MQYSIHFLSLSTPAVIQAKNQLGTLYHTELYNKNSYLAEFFERQKYIVLILGNTSILPLEWGNLNKRD